MTQNNSLIALKNHLTASSGLSSTSLVQRKAQAAQQREGNILLLDISGSMADVLSNGQRRIDVLWTLVQKMRSQNIPFRTATFSTFAEWSDAVDCPQPYASTALAEALVWLNANASPVKVTLITDGLPDNAEAAIDAAKRLGVPINVLYVGPDDASYSSQVAKGFCSALAAASNGSYAANSLNNEMLQLNAQSAVRLMLTSGEEGKNKTIQL
jgi:hypothetical protein